MAPLQLKSTGELILLNDPQGSPLDYVTFPELPPGKTYTRIPEGTPPFAITNATALTKTFIPPPTLNKQSGVHSNGTLISLEAPDERMTIRYTLNGAYPNINATAYTSPLELKTNMTLRAACFDKEGNAGQTITRIYRTTPAKQIPYVHIAIDPKYLRSPQWGIMNNTLARGRKSERPCHITIFYPDNTIQEREAAIRIQGRSTRWRVTDVQKSFRVRCRDYLGENGQWPGPLFEDAGSEHLHSFVIKAGTVPRAKFGMWYMQKAGTLTPRSRLALIHFNQAVWGIRLLLEDPNDEHVLQHWFGHLDLDIIKLKTLNPLKRGTIAAYKDTWEIAQLIKYASFAEQLVSPDYFLRWMVGVQCLSLGDNAQGYIVRDNKAPPPAWTFINWDMDGTLEGIISTTNQMQALQEQRAHIANLLLGERRHKKNYLRIYQDHLNHLFSTNQTLPKLNWIREVYTNHMQEEWHGTYNEEPRWVTNKTFETFQTEVLDNIEACRHFLKHQPEEMLHYIAAKDYTRPALPITIRAPQSLKYEVDGYPVQGNWEGRYFPDYRINIALSDVAPHAASLLTVNGATYRTNFFETIVQTNLQIEIIRDE